MYGIGFDPATDTINDLIFLKSSIIDRNVVPTGEYNQYSPYLEIVDKNEAKLAEIYYRHATNGSRRISFSCFDENADGVVAYLGFDGKGNPYCSFPDTTCCDGQFVNKDPATTIVSNVSINGSSKLTYTLNLPNDGHNYMVWIMTEATTGATSGDYINVKVASDIMTSTTVARAQTRTASTALAGSTLCLVVSSSHKIYLNRSSNWNGTVSLYMIGYRRIGTNA